MLSQQCTMCGVWIQRRRSRCSKPSNSIPTVRSVTISPPILGNSGQFEESLHWARIALERNPQNPMVYYHVAAPLLSMRNDAALEKWLAIWRQRLPSFRLRSIEVLYKLEQAKVADALADARKMVASAQRTSSSLACWRTWRSLPEPPIWRS